MKPSQFFQRTSKLIVAAFCLGTSYSATLTFEGSTGPLTIASAFTSPVSWFGLTIAAGDSLDFSVTIDDSVADANASAEFGVYFGAITEGTFSVGMQSVTLGTASFITNLLEVRNRASQDLFLLYAGNSSYTLQIDLTDNTHSVFTDDSLSPFGGVGTGGVRFSDFQASRALLANSGETSAFASPIATASIPEPASVLLAAFGIAAAVSLRRRHDSR